MPIKQLGEYYGFTVEYADDSSNQMNLYINNHTKLSIEQKKKFLKGPSNTFVDSEEFAFDLKNGEFDIPEGYSMLQIGSYDYIILKDSKQIK